MNAESTIQARRVFLVMMVLSLWAVAGLGLKYFRNWIGNRQEMYPTVILPGFGRNPAKTSQYFYSRYHLSVVNEQGMKTELNAKQLLGRHWIAKIESLVNAEQLESLDRSQADWINDLPSDSQQVEAVIEKRRYLPDVDANAHPIETEVQKTFRLD